MTWQTWYYSDVTNVKFLWRNFTLARLSHQRNFMFFTSELYHVCHIREISRLSHQNNITSVTSSLRDIILMWKTWNFSGVTNVTNVKFLCDVIIWYGRIWSDLIGVDTLTMRYTTIGYLLCNVNPFFSPCLLIFVEHFSTCFLIYYCSFLTDQKCIEEKIDIFLCILF
jgi:hypothetical protein